MKSTLFASAFCLGLTIATASVAGPARISPQQGWENARTGHSFQESASGAAARWAGRLREPASLSDNSLETVSPAISANYGDTVARAFDVGSFYAVPVNPDERRQFNRALANLEPSTGVQARWRHFFVRLTPADGDARDSLFTVGVTFPVE